MKTLALSIAASITISGCATTADNAYNTTRQFYPKEPITSVCERETINLRCMTLESVESRCGIGVLACHKKVNDESIIFTVCPKTWADREAMAILGHEVMHAFCAEHK